MGISFKREDFINDKTRILSLTKEYKSIMALHRECGFTTSKINNIVSVLMKENKISRVKMKFEGSRSFHYVSTSLVSEYIEEEKKNVRTCLLKYLNKLDNFTSSREIYEFTGHSRSHVMKTVKALVLRGNLEEKGFIEYGQRMLKYRTIEKVETGELNISKPFLDYLKLLTLTQRNSSFIEWYCT